VKRLREQVTTDDRDVAFAAKLVATQGPRRAASTAMRARVLLGVMNAGRRTPARAWLLRPAVFVVALIIGVGVASATLGPRLVRALFAGASPSAPTSPSSTAPATNLTPAPVPPDGAAQRQEQSGESPAPVDDRPAAVADRRAHVHRIRTPGPRGAPSAAALAAPAPRSAAAPAAEAALVLDAFRALRRNHDAATAERLLQAYMTQFPDGALVEDALALAIEAASARGDQRAATLAARYLQQFPRGRYRDTAERARARFAPVPNAIH
jgi:hypothetical protein